MYVTNVVSVVVITVVVVTVMVVVEVVVVVVIVVVDAAAEAAAAVVEVVVVVVAAAAAAAFADATHTNARELNSASVFGDLVRQQMSSATSFSVWQHVELTTLWPSGKALASLAADVGSIPAL